MRWLIKRERSNDDAVGDSQGGDDCASPRESSPCACTEKIGVTADEELIESFPSTHSDLDAHEGEGRRRFALFRRRGSRPCEEDGENQRIELTSSGSDQDSPNAETAVAAVKDASLLNCSDEELNNSEVDEGDKDDDQTIYIKEGGDSSGKFNWFGLLSKNDRTTSSCEENESDSESSIEQQTGAVKDSDEQLNRIDGDAVAEYEADSSVLEHDMCVSAKEDHIDLTTPRRFSWFGLVQPQQSASSCMENDSSASAMQEDKDEKKLAKSDDEGKDKEEEIDEDGCTMEEGSGVDDIACSDDECCQNADAEDKESSAEEVSTGENSPDDSVDTDDLVEGILRLQAQFDECSAQDQEEEQQSPFRDHDLQCVASIDVMTNNNTESESFVKKETPLNDEILALWRRRQRLKRKLQFDGPIPETSSSAPKSMKMLAATQLEAGGGRNEENLRSLDLEAHLIDTNSGEKMAKMEIMSAEEKAHEDLLYDMFLQDCLLMAGEEPLDGYDNRGWYSITTTREDGEADLEYMDTSTMDVATEDDGNDTSNRWLNGIENAALFIFAPDLYFIKQMNEESLQQPKYLPTSNKEDDEQDEGQERGWFGKLFTNKRKLKEDVEFSQIPS